VKIRLFRNNGLLRFRCQLSILAVLKILTSILFTCLSFLALGQVGKDSPIQKSDFDAKFLEHLIKTQIDSVRKSKGLRTLQNDSISYLAAKDQSIYITERAKLSHYQDANAAKKTPQKRVEYFGAEDYFTGENVLVVPFNTNMFYSHDKRKETHFVGNYARVAYDMMVTWVNSKHHFENIVTEGYTITGVAVDVNWTREEIYCTQVFAEVHGEWKSGDWSSMFPFSSNKKKARTDKRVEEKPAEGVVWKKIPWGLKLPSKDKQCNQTVIDFLTSDQLKPGRQGKNITLCVYDLNKFKRLFQKGKDGLAFEFISFEEAYSCEPGEVGLKNNLKNVESPVFGYVTKPIYKKEILQQVQAHEDRQRGKKKERNKCYPIVIGQIPPQYLNRKTDVRLLSIQKKRICSVIQFQPICGRFLDHDPPLIPLPLAFQPDSNFRPNQAPEVFEFLVPFEKNSTEFDRGLLDPLVELLESKDLFVRKAKIEAYASLEGTLENNQMLFEKRADRIVSVIEAVQEDSIPREVVATENWKDFLRDVKDSDHKFLAKLDSAELKDYVNENSKELEYLLKGHRYTSAKFYVYQRLNQQNKLEFALDEFNARVLELIKKKRLPKQTELRLTKIQNYLHWRGSLGDTTWQNLYLPATASFADFNLRQWLFAYAFTDLDPYPFYKALSGLKNFLERDEQYLFALNAHVVNNKGHEMLGEVVGKTHVRALLDSELLRVEYRDELELLFHIYNANGLWMKYGGRNLRRAKSSLSYIKKYFDAKELDNALKIAVASYYILFHQYQWAQELLEEEAKYVNPDPEVLSLYLKIMAFQELEGIAVNEQTADHTQFLINAEKSLGNKGWCELFLGPCNINFQVFEDRNVLEKYCERCR
jgi:uncharacterized protein YkwD